MRKPRITQSGHMSPLTQLKQLVLTDPQLRDTLYDATHTLTCQQWIQCVNDVLDIRLSGRSAVTRFRQHVQTLHALEDQEFRRELIIQRYREQYPNETEEQLNQRAILFFKQEAFATGDRDAFIKIGRFSLAVQAQQSREKSQAIQARLMEAKIRLLDLKIEMQQLAFVAASRQSAAICTLQQAAVTSTPTAEPPQPEAAPEPSVPAPEPQIEDSPNPVEHSRFRLTPPAPFPLFPMFPLIPQLGFTETRILPYLMPGRARATECENAD